MIKKHSNSPKEAEVYLRTPLIWLSKWIIKLMYYICIYSTYIVHMEHGYPKMYFLNLQPMFTVATSRSRSGHPLKLFPTTLWMNYNFKFSSLKYYIKHIIWPFVEWEKKDSSNRKFHFHFFFACIVFWGHTSSIWGLLLALHTGITPGGFSGPGRMLGIKPGPDTYKASALPTLLSLLDNITEQRSNAAKYEWIGSVQFGSWKNTNQDFVKRGVGNREPTGIPRRKTGSSSGSQGTCPHKTSSSWRSTCPSALDHPLIPTQKRFC